MVKSAQFTTLRVALVAEITIIYISSNPAMLSVNGGLVIMGMTVGTTEPGIVTGIQVTIGTGIPLSEVLP